ncbi:hypothetical protein E4U23_006614, partial [Claviceps purpurea]
MFLSNQSLSIPEKLRVLEKEAQCSFAWHGWGADMFRNSSDEGKSTKCYLCQSTKYLIAECPFQDASRDHARNLRMAMEGKLYKSKSDTTKPRRSKTGTKSSSRRRRHGHSAACESDSTDTESTSEDSDSDDDSDKTERVMLSKENI